jgi:hypothetical protein
VVERGLEELVLDEQSPVIGHGRDNLAERLLEQALAAPDAVLPGVVGAVGQPQAEVSRPGFAHDFHALQAVLHGLAADGVVVVTEGSELMTSS